MVSPNRDDASGFIERESDLNLRVFEASKLGDEAKGPRNRVAINSQRIGTKFFFKGINYQNVNPF